MPSCNVRATQVSALSHGKPIPHTLGHGLAFSAFLHSGHMPQTLSSPSSVGAPHMGRTWPRGRERVQSAHGNPPPPRAGI